MRQKGRRKSLSINELLGEMDPNAEPGELGRAFLAAARPGSAEALGVRIKRPFDRGARNVASEDELARIDGIDSQDQ